MTSQPAPKLRRLARTLKAAHTRWRYRPTSGRRTLFINASFKIVLSSDHSSGPVLPSSATKKLCNPDVVNAIGFDELAPGEISWICTVRGAEPSVFHNSTPLRPSEAANSAQALVATCWIAPTPEPLVPGLRSLTKDVGRWYNMYCYNFHTAVVKLAIEFKSIYERSVKTMF